MNTMKVMREILKMENLSLAEASAKVGRSDTYFGSVLNQRKSIGSNVLAEICDAFGYELVIRSKDGEREFIIDS